MEISALKKKQTTFEVEAAVAVGGCGRMMGDNLLGEKGPLVVMVLGAGGQLFIPGDVMQMLRGNKWKNPSVGRKSDGSLEEKQ